jgi:hypothetical protein
MTGYYTDCRLTNFYEKTLKGSVATGIGGAEHLHFTPTSSLWLNLIERIFAEITQCRIAAAAFPLSPPWSTPSMSTFETAKETKTIR